MTKYRIYQEGPTEFWIEKKRLWWWTREVTKGRNYHVAFTLEAAQELVAKYLNEELARRPVQKFRPVCHYPILQIK